MPNNEKILGANDSLNNHEATLYLLFIDGKFDIIYNPTNPSDLENLC